MVKVTAIILASFAVAPLVLAANPGEPAGPAVARSVEDPDLEIREPTPQPFGRWLKRAARTAKGIAGNRWIKKLTPYAGTALKLIARDENGDLYIREVDLSDLSERDLDDLADLAERDFDDFDDLEVREPRKRRGFLKGIKKVKSLAGTAGRFAKFAHPAGAALSLLGREFDEDELDARDYEDLVDPLEREYEDDLELDARDPWFGENWFKKAKQVHNQGSGVLNKVNDANRWLTKVGLRELGDDFDLEERDFDDDVFDLDARDPWFGERWFKKAKQVHNQGSGVLSKVNDANRWLTKVGLRELGDEMEERSLDDLDALD